MTVAMEAPPNRKKQSTSKQKKARTTLSAAEDAQHWEAPRPWIPALAGMRLLVQSASLAPAGSSIVRLRAGCTALSPPPLSPQQLVSFAAQSSMSHKDQRSHGRAISLRFLLIPQLLQPHLVSMHFRCNCSACRHCTLTSIQSCCRTPGNPQTTSKMAHLTLGCCIAVVAHSVMELRDMALHVRVSSCSFYQGVPDRTVQSGPRSPCVGSRTGGRGAQPAIAHTCPHHCLHAEHTWSAGLHLVSHRVAALLPSSIEHSVAVLSVTCAWPSSSCQCKFSLH